MEIGWEIIAIYAMNSCTYDNFARKLFVKNRVEKLWIKKIIKISL